MADEHKIIFTFDTNTTRDFVFGVSNAKANPDTTSLENVAQGILDGNTLIPKEGNVISLKKIEQVATTTTAII